MVLILLEGIKIVPDKAKGIHQECPSTNVRTIELSKYGLRIQIPILNSWWKQETKNTYIYYDEKSS